MTKDPGKLRTITYKEVCEKIIRDLDAAEKLLEKDPILVGSNTQLNQPAYDWEGKPQDEWQFYRQVRFNYYAVKGAKARYYHWIGDKENKQGEKESGNYYGCCSIGACVSDVDFAELCCQINRKC